MSQEKIGFEQFIIAVPAEHQAFIHDLHDFMADAGCRIAFEEKKSGLLASIKYGKPPRAVANFLFRKQGLLVRIYGENIGGYRDFLHTLPTEMVAAIDGSSTCKRLTENGCSPKCMGYDFEIGDAHFQKCRYGCFEFLVTDKAKPFIRAFVEKELGERAK